MRILVAPLLTVLFCLPGLVRAESASDLAQRYVGSWGTDQKVLAAFGRIPKEEALKALRAVFAGGRRFGEVPTGISHGSAPLPNDPNFQVRYTLYVPPDYDPARAHPLLLYVHGTYSNGDSGMTRVLRGFRERGVIILCPSSEIQTRGWTSTRYERLMQLAALDRVQRTLNVDPLRIWVGGYSRGGHASWALPSRHPGIFAAAFPMAGGPRLRGIRFLDNLLHTRFRASWGAKDEWGLVWCNRRAAERLKELKLDAESHERADDGHVFAPDYPAIVRFVTKAHRPALPRIVVCTADSVEDGRAFWIRFVRIDTRRAKLPPARKGTLVLGGKPRTVTVGGVPTPKGFDKKPQEERWAYFVKEAKDYRAWLRAVAEGDNVVRVECKNVRTFNVLVSDGLFDLSRPIRVLTNGRTALARKVRPDPVWALERLARTADWSVLYLAQMRVRVK
jgi:predicted esterase